jgi:hypothetical protein
LTFEPKIEDFSQNNLTKSPKTDFKKPQNVRRFLVNFVCFSIDSIEKRKKLLFLLAFCLIFLHLLLEIYKMIVANILSKRGVVQQGLLSMCRELGLRPVYWDSIKNIPEDKTAVTPTLWLIEDSFSRLSLQVKALQPMALLILYQRHQKNASKQEHYYGTIQEGFDCKAQLEAILKELISVSYNDRYLYQSLAHNLHKRHKVILFLLSAGIEKRDICSVCAITFKTYDNYFFEIKQILKMDTHELIPAVYRSGLFNELLNNEDYSSKLFLCPDNSLFSLNPDLLEAS